MGDPQTVTLRDKNGQAYDVPVAQLPGALAHGLTVEDPQARIDRLAEQVQHETYGGVAGGALAGAAGFASGLTLGGSDVALAALGSEDTQVALRGLREENPGISFGSNIAGAVAPAILSGGATAEVSAGEIGAEALSGIRSLAAATPAGQVARLGSKIAGLGEGAGLVGRTLATAAGGATEGALQNAGGYISDVALGDRKLSADGFVGAMGQGALWGGVAGGALSLSSEGLTAARRLFPAADMTAEGAKAAKLAATNEIQAAVDDSQQLAQTAEQQLRDIRGQEEIRNPGFKQRIEEIKLKAAQDVADAQVAAAQSKAAIVGSKARTAELKAASVEKQLAEKAAVKSTKPALDFLNSFATPIQEAAPEIAEEAGSTLLERQLSGTKTALDQGKTIAEVGKMRSNVIGLSPVEDAMNVELAKVNPEAAKIQTALTAARDSSQELSEWLGTHGSLEEQLAGTKKALDKGLTLGEVGKMRPTTIGARQAPAGEEILAATKEPVSAKVEKALSAKSVDINDDIAKTAPMITRHEAANADLAETLGPNAPSTSQERAQGFREAQKQAADKGQAQVQLTQEVISKTPPTSPGRQLLSKAGNAGAMYEALRMMGVPLPNPHDIPVIGPLLSMYLKAKVLGKAFGRFGGKVGQTAETAIASKSAALRQRVYQAVDAGLAGAAKVTKAASTVAGGPAAILGHTLFDSDAPKPAPPPFTSAPAQGSLGDLYLARAAEVNAAMQPGAIAKAVTGRIQTSDPEALQEIVATTERKLQYLAQEMPKPSSPPGVLDGRIWLPSKADLTAWTKCIAAVEDPAGVLERAAIGQATAKEIEAVKTVYPSLYADGQQRLLKQVAEGKAGDLSTTQRALLSRTWGIPLDSASHPDHAAWMQASYQSPAPAPQPSAPMGSPTIAGPINIGQRTLTGLDTRG